MVEPEHDLATVLAGLVVLLLVLAAIRHYSRKSSLPAESWTLILGQAYGLSQKQIPALPVLKLIPDLVLFVLLPVLIFASARSLSPRDLQAMAVPIAFLATAGVIATRRNGRASRFPLVMADTEDRFSARRRADDPSHQRCPETLGFASLHPFLRYPSKNSRRGATAHIDRLPILG